MKCKVKLVSSALYVKQTLLATQSIFMLYCDVKNNKDHIYTIPSML